MSSIFHTKFVTLLRTFDEDELQDLQHWLKSPWCNSNRNLIPLLEELRKYHPGFNSKRITAERLFKRVLPEGKYSKRRLNNLMSAGFKAAKRYLIFQQFSQDEHRQQQLCSVCAF